MIIDTDKLLTEQVNPRSKNIDTLPTEEMLRVINDEDKTVAYAVEKEINHIALGVEAIAAALRLGGRLIYIGAGTSGRLAILDAAECPPTFGSDPGQVVGLIAGGEKALTQAVEGAEDDKEAVISQLQAVELSSRDVLVGIAASGRTPYVIAGLEYGNALGAVTIGISCSPDSAVTGAAKIAITPLVGPEVVTGSTRLKAGTAQKMVLNMLSTGAMIKLGKVYGNLMVDVQPTNLKLKERAKRIVAQAAGVSREEAGAVLTRASWNPKLAIVMLRRNCSANDAAKLLVSAEGFVATALNEQ